MANCTIDVQEDTTYNCNPTHGCGCAWWLAASDSWEGWRGLVTCRVLIRRQAANVFVWGVHENELIFVLILVEV